VRAGSRRISRNCRTSYSDETGIAVAAFSNRRVGNLDAKASGLASGPGSLDAPNQQPNLGPHLTRLFRSRCVPTRLRGHRVETARLVLSLRAFVPLGEGQKCAPAIKPRLRRIASLDKIKKPRPINRPKRNEVYSPTCRCRYPSPRSNR
jgi:hypothetical protein